MKTKFILCALLNVTTIFYVFSQKYYYISDAGNFQNGPYQILRYNEDGTNGKVFIKEGLAWPQDILFLPGTNQVIISNLSSNSIDTYDSESGALLGRFISDIQGPTRMRLGKDGMLYILQWKGDGKVKKYDIKGNFVDDATQSGVPTSIGFDWDKNGDLYVSSFNGKFVERFDKEGKSKGKFINSGLFGPTNIQFDPNGNLIVLDYSSGRVLLYDKDGKMIKTLFAGVPRCEGIHVTADGKILVGTASSVRLYDKNNFFQKFIVQPGDQGLLNPNAVVYRQLTTSSTLDSLEKTYVDFLLSVGENKYIVSKNAFKVSVVNIFNFNGLMVKTHDFNQNDSLDLSDLSGGLYFASTIISNNKEMTQKLVVLK